MKKEKFKLLLFYPNEPMVEFGGKYDTKEAFKGGDQA